MLVKFSFMRLRKIAEIGELTVDVTELTEEAVREKLSNLDFKTFLVTDVEPQEEKWQFAPFTEGNPVGPRTIN